MQVSRLRIGCLAVLLAAVVGAIVAADAQQQSPPNVARYDNYRLYRLYLTTDEQVAAFQELERVSDSVIFYGHARKVGQSLSILVAAHKIADITELLQRFRVEHRILNYNFQNAIDDQYNSVRAKTTPGNELDWQHYFHLDTIHAWLDTLIAEFPDSVHPIVVGQSFEGRPLRGIRLTVGRNNAHHDSAAAPRTGIFIEAGIHAREWISPATSTYIIDQLLRSADPAVRDLALSFDWYFVPVLNPDGYRFTFDSDRMWRKTRQPYGVCVGTDLNRNFDSHWNTIGASSDPCTYDFAGSAANSEPEARTVSEWLRENRNASRIETFISLHSFSQLMMFPHGHTAAKPPNYDDLRAMGRKAVEALAVRYGTVYQTGSIHEIIYPSSGGSMDWTYEELGIPVAFTIELRGPPDSEVMFNLPAAEIEPVGKETLDALVALVNEARRLGYYRDAATRQTRVDLR